MRGGQFTLIQAATLSLIFPLSLRAETYDHWVTTHFTPTQIDSGLASPVCDHDEDSCPNLFEYLGGSDPMDKSSLFTFDLALDPFLNEVTVSFTIAGTCEDIDYLVLVSDDLVTWTRDGMFVSGGPALSYHLNGRCYVKIGVQAKSGVMLDSDGDGLNDFFEESLVSADPGDGFTHIGEIQPGDDFDGDGTLNIDEEANGAMATTFTKPAAFDPDLLAGALAGSPPPSPASLVIHTELK